MRRVRLPGSMDPAINSRCRSLWGIFRHINIRSGGRTTIYADSGSSERVTVIVKVNQSRRLRHAVNRPQFES